MADLNKVLVDTAYVAVGFSLLGFQRAQVRRHELSRQLTALARSLDQAATPARADLDRRVDELSQRLPDQARVAARSLRGAAQASEQLLRQIAGVEPPAP